MDGLRWKWLDSAVRIRVRVLIGHVPRGVVNFFKFACSTTVTGNVLLASGRVLWNLQSQMPQTIKQLHLQIKCLTNLQMWTILMYVTQYSDMTPPTLGWAFMSNFWKMTAPVDPGIFNTQILPTFRPLKWHKTQGGWADGLWCRGASAPWRSSEKKNWNESFPECFCC